MSVHVLVFSLNKTPSYSVGIQPVLSYLDSCDRVRFKYCDLFEVTRDDIAWCDVLISVRGAEYAELDIINEAKRLGRYTIYFFDDDLLNIPDNLASSDYYRDEIIQHNIKRIMKSCNFLWCVNKSICLNYGPLFESVALTDATIPIQSDAVHSQSKNPLRIVYAGSIDHQSTVQKYLVPAISRILSEFGSNVDITYIGVKPEMIEKADNVHIEDFLADYDSYRQVLTSSGFSIGLAVIETSEFYRSKYYNKFVEYASAGIIGIYTNSEPYTSIINPGMNGLLCNNTEEEWYQAIKRSIVDSNWRRSAADSAYQCYKTRFSAENIALNLTKQIPFIISHHAPVIRADKVHIRSWKYNFVFYYQRIRILTRQNGIKGIFIAIEKAFKKIKSKLSG